MRVPPPASYLAVEPKHVEPGSRVTWECPVEIPDFGVRMVVVVEATDAAHAWALVRLEVVRALNGSHRVAAELYEPDVDSLTP